MHELQSDSSEIPENEIREHCLNCGTELGGRYCSSCGQDSRTFKRSLSNILEGFAVGLFELDGKVVQSIRPILFSPGALTLAFLEGKRRAQVNPFQLYAFFSFLFFFTTVVMNADFSGEQDFGKGKNSASEVADSIIAQTGLSSASDSSSYLSNEINADVLPESLASYDSSQARLPEAEKDGWAERFLMRRLIVLKNKIARNGKLVLFDMFENFKSNIPNTLIFLLPVFALLLKLIYIRQKFYFVDHLIFSIHQFCFLFLMGTFWQISHSVLPESLVIWIISGIALYFIVAMKRVYLQSWRKTVFKFFLVSALYSIFATIALIISFLYAAIIQT